MHIYIGPATWWPKRVGLLKTYINATEAYNHVIEEVDTNVQAIVNNVVVAMESFTFEQGV